MLPCQMWHEKLCASSRFGLATGPSCLGVLNVGGYLGGQSGLGFLATLAETNQALAERWLCDAWNAWLRQKFYSPTTQQHNVS